MIRLSERSLTIFNYIKALFSSQYPETDEKAGLSIFSTRRDKKISKTRLPSHGCTI